MADLARFVMAQDPVIDRALGELRAGAKSSHWMWFVFPQIAGLGRSAMAQRYAIADLAEARAYLAHALLRRRLASAPPRSPIASTHSTMARATRRRSRGSRSYRYSGSASFPSPLSRGEGDRERSS